MRIGKLAWVPLQNLLVVLISAGSSIAFSIPGFINLRPTIFQAEQRGETIEKPTLAVILPAYNESLRIEETLNLYHDFLVGYHGPEKSEIWVVDDGSTDGTADVVRSCSKHSTALVPVHCVSLDSNQGKGSALAEGIDQVRLHHHNNNNVVVLLADADGSADIRCLPDLYQTLQGLTGDDWNSPAVVVGRRTDASSSSWHRLLLRRGFRMAVRILCGDLGVSDTQCGFKLLPLVAARRLYSNLHLRGWSHDVEVLVRAKDLGFPIAERDVPWQDKAGSKLVTSPGGTMGASSKMLAEIVQLSVLYKTGLWK